MRRLLLIKITVLLSGILFFSSVSNKAQSLEETLNNLSNTFGAAYVEPIVSAFGSNLNSGWVSGVPSASLVGFTLRLKAVGIGSFFSDENKRFNTSGNFHFTQSQANFILQQNGLSSGPTYDALMTQLLRSQGWTVKMSGPTIVGSEDENVILTFPDASLNGIAETNLNLEEVTGFLDELPALPSAAIQLTVGTVAGTHVSLRWFPDIEIQDLGKFSFFGIGFLHNPGVWLNNPLPIDLAIGFFTQTMKVGDIFESSATQYGLWASKTFGMGISITPYAGLTMETSKTTVSYDYTYDTPASSVTSNLNLDLEGNNDFGLTVGANLKLAVLNLFVDYKMAKTSTVSGGLWFGF